MPETARGFELDSKRVGAFPLVNHILKRLHFEQCAYRVSSDRYNMS